MKKLLLIITPILFIAILVSNCNRKVNAKTSSSDRTTKSAKLITYTKKGITLTELYSPEQFENATIAQSTGSTGIENLDNNTIVINYTTTNYELGKQSDTNSIKNCANSAKGQHIHCIIDNQSYTAVYDNTATIKIPEDGQHVVLSFLSRSYHESIKHKNAYAISTVITGKSRYYSRYAAPDLDKPMLFFSRPKGEYKGGETDAILLDFYLVNCDLSENGYKVKAEINDVEFILTKWSGYFMEGLPIGDNTVKLTLLDKDNKVVESPFNTVERKFKLSK